MAQSFICRDAGGRFGLLIIKPLAITGSMGLKIAIFTRCRYFRTSRREHQLTSITFDRALS
jgi:hypothetical protein